MYGASFTARGWKRYECVECWCIYRRRFSRWSCGNGETEQTAHESAIRSAVGPFLQDAERNPCPTCGLLPARAYIDVRVNSQTAFFVCALVANGLFIFLGGTGAMSQPNAAIGVAASTLFFTLCHWLVAMYDPNRDRERNKAVAADLIDREEMTVLRHGHDDNTPNPPAYTSQHRELLVVALFAFAVSLLALVPALWWAGVVLAFVLLFTVGCCLIVIEQRIQKHTGAAVVERLDGKDGDIVLLTDDPDNPIPPPAPPPASQIEKPWKRT